MREATPLGENSWKSAPGFLWILPHVPFAGFAPHPFAVINFAHQHNSMLSPVNPSGGLDL